MDLRLVAHRNPGVGVHSFLLTVWKLRHKPLPSGLHTLVHKTAQWLLAHKGLERVCDSRLPALSLH